MKEYKREREREREGEKKYKVPSSVEPRKKTYDILLYWLFNTDPSNGLY